MSHFRADFFNLAIVGDVHGLWTDLDYLIIEKINPDAILFVGDFANGDLRVSKKIKNINIPYLCILGNHDHGHDKSGENLLSQLNLFGERHCGWKFKILADYLNVLGARPCSSGGGFYLSKEVESVFGPVSLNDSVEKINNEFSNSCNEKPLIVLGHSGPAGLGGQPDSICGRDWKKPFIDWGDTDLAISINFIQKQRFLDLVVFGHMHSDLCRGKGKRRMFHIDKAGTFYLNAAVVPRYKKASDNSNLINFSWVVFKKKRIIEISSRWYSANGEINESEVFFRR